MKAIMLRKEQNKAFTLPLLLRGILNRYMLKHISI